MKTIGLLGGMSWESTQHYYQLINEGIKQRLGGFHSAKIILNSVDFAEIEKLQKQQNWSATAKILTKAAKGVESAGADCLLICTNTMHKVAPEIASSINIPLLHIADATANHLIKKNINKVGLIGTAYTMEQEFYKGRITHKFGIEVITPNAEDRQTIHQIIYQELCLGKVNNKAKNDYLTIINKLNQQGAQGIILGCTEIGLLIKQADTPIPLFDTTLLHAQEAINYALNNL